MPLHLASARNHYRLSALIAQRAVREARQAESRGSAAIASVVAVHQATQANRSQAAVGEMLAEQGITQAAEGLLNSLAFTTSVRIFESMLEGARKSPTDDAFDRLVASLVQDAGRAAESVATAARARIYHVRYLSPPSCSRCAVLAGRVYRYSEGFRRHPGCDCVMIPTTVAATNAQDPVELYKRGLVTGLSKADAQALEDGADFNSVVNIRARSAGLQESGRVLTRRGRLTPEGVYATTNTREEALSALQAAGYLR